MKPLLLVTEIIHRQTEIGEFLDLFFRELEIQFSPSFSFDAHPFSFGLEKKVDLFLGKRGVIDMQCDTQIKPVDFCGGFFNLNLNIPGDIAIPEAGEIGIEFDEASLRALVEPRNKLLWPVFALNALFSPNFRVVKCRSLLCHLPKPERCRQDRGFVYLNERVMWWSFLGF